MKHIITVTRTESDNYEIEAPTREEAETIVSDMLAGDRELVEPKSTDFIQWEFTS